VEGIRRVTKGDRALNDDAKNRGPEVIALALVVLLTLPGIVYFALQWVRFSGLRYTQEITDAVFLLGFVAPFSTLLAAFPLVVLWFGGRRLSLKIIGTVLIALAITGLVLYQVDRILG